MANAPPTLAAILQGIADLKKRLTMDLNNVINFFPNPTPTQQQFIQKVQTLYNTLQGELDNASTAIPSADNPVDSWNTWIGPDGEIGDNLRSFDELFSAILSTPVGMCVYSTGTACMTQAQCSTLPGGQWTQGGCPSI
jgi:hypothetical protein